MKFREEKWLEKKVGEWAKEKLITSQQAEAILEKTKKESGTYAFNASMLLTALGGLCVALGIILVISYNWEKIPAFIKIAGFLVLLALAGEGYQRVPAENKTVRTALLILWLMLPLAGIGLWAQIYQLSGDPLKPLLIWLLLGLPLVLATGNRPLILLHTIGLVWAAFQGTYAQGTWFAMECPGLSWRFTGWEGTSPQFLQDYGPAFLIVALFWTYTVYQARKYLGDKGRLLILLCLLVFLWALFFPTPLSGPKESCTLPLPAPSWPFSGDSGALFA